MDPNQVRFDDVEDDGTPFMKATLLRNSGVVDWFASLTETALTVRFDDGSTETHIALANAVLPLYSQQFEVDRRDGDLVMVDLVAHADVRSTFPDGVFGSRSALRTATVRSGFGLTAYNGVLLEPVGGSV
ncbi:hypothetical protein [Curtobacterium sp. MCBD17_040]|uniref:hypothetical protein n=1 Tax=Curtobacterium sp. MCBD17_040 TaxID=2175674 RepID=UPI0011B53000|nr:hypothetical protein [Curtobacterium sp. MCBD17_040]WIB65884.1 hypothetical protein DEI94_17365 [Curtobacterium sp. MCBD17_040]